MTDLPPEPADALPEPEAEAGSEDDFDWQDFLSDYFGEKTAEPPSEGEEGQPAEEEALVPDREAAAGDQPAPEPEEEPAAPEYVEIAGKKIPTNAAPQVAELYDFIHRHPKEAAAFLDVLEGKATVVPADAQQQQPETEPAAPFNPPADEDWEFVPDTLREKAATVDQLAEKVQQFEQYFEAQQQQQAEAAAAEAMRAVTDGVAAFRETYDVTDDDLEQLRQEAADLGVARRLQETNGGDATKAVRDALEIAYLRNPQYRERELERHTARALEESQRQAKLGALNGSGGSAPRTEPQPSTAEQRQASIVDAVRAAMNSGG